MLPRDIADLREKVRRRAFLVREQAKMKTKIRNALAYEGIKPPTGYGLLTRKCVAQRRGLGLEPVDCYLRITEPLKREILRLNRLLRGLAKDDRDAQLLIAIPGVGYYIALLLKAEVGGINRFHSRDPLSSYAGLVPSTHNSGGGSRHGRITKEGSS